MGLSVCLSLGLTVVSSSTLAVAPPFPTPATPLPGVHGISHIGLSVPRSFGKWRQLYLGIVMLQVCSTEGCLPIRNVCLFKDGKGAFKNIMRRLPVQLPELPEICVYLQGIVRSHFLSGVLSCSFILSFEDEILVRPLRYSSERFFLNPK